MTTPGVVDEDGIPVAFNPVSVVHCTLIDLGFTS
jgi:hypothetical protein